LPSQTRNDTQVKVFPKREKKKMYQKTDGTDDLMENTAWGLFAASGSIGYYMLYKALKKTDDDMHDQRGADLE